MAERCIDGDANLTRHAERGVALKRDHVGGRGVVEEIGVKLGERGVGEENEGELPGRNFRFRKLSIQGVDHGRDRPSIEAQPRMLIGDRERAPRGAAHALATWVGGSVVAVG